MFVSMSSRIQIIRNVLLVLCYLWFCYLMLKIMLQYIPWRNDVAFLNIKQQALKWSFYEPVFFIHVFSSILLLPPGLVQFSPYVRKRWPHWHRLFGKSYVWLVLIFVAPTGIIMGLFANGGWSAQLAFCMLGLLWFMSTWYAMKCAMQRRWLEHRDWMIRSFALMLSAITLRLWKWILVALFHPHPMDVYRWIAWLGWGLNLIIAEYLIFQIHRREKIIKK
jgi:hypothetical protein